MSRPHRANATSRTARGNRNGSGCPGHAYSREATTKPAATSSAPSSECWYTSVTSVRPPSRRRKCRTASRSVPRGLPLRSHCTTSASAPAVLTYRRSACALMGHTSSLVTGRRPAAMSSPASLRCRIGSLSSACAARTRVLAGGTESPCSRSSACSTWASCASSCFCPTTSPCTGTGTASTPKACTALSTRHAVPTSCARSVRVGDGDGDSPAAASPHAPSCGLWAFPQPAWRQASRSVYARITISRSSPASTGMAWLLA
jgi:hypothetical protein